MIQIEKINVSEHEFVGVIKLARPERANALEPEMIKQFAKTLRQWRKQECRLLLLGGNGKHFCAGFDLKNFLAGKKELKKRLIELGELFSALAQFPAPTVAVVQGSVAAGGLVLSACCDFAVAEEGAVFSLTETKMGFASGMTYPFLLRRMDLNLLNRLIILKEAIPAKEMFAKGFLQSVNGKERLSEAVQEFVNSILLGDVVAQSEFKRFIGKHTYYRFPQGKEWSAAMKVLTATSGRKVVHRRIENFLNKVKPGGSPDSERDSQLPISWSWESL